MKNLVKTGAYSLRFNERGFTLIELLIAIGIIAVLLAVAVVAINPARQFVKTNDIRRMHDLKQIVSAIQQNMVDNRGPFSCGALTPGEAIMRSPTTSPPVPDPSDPTKTVYDICNCLVPTYLPVMPVDPQRGGYVDCGNYNTEYTIQEVASLLLRAPHTQLVAETGIVSVTLPGKITVKPPNPDFNLSVNPNSGSVVQGDTASADVIVTSYSGFSELVTFSTSINPSEPTINISFTPANNCTLPPDSTCSSTMNIITNATTPPDTYTITVTGTDGGLTRTTNYSLTVTESLVPDFSISASPTTIKAPQNGTSQTSTITITSLNNFNSAVILSVTSGLPAGATANFNPSPATPPPNGTITSNFTVTTSNATAGSYNLTIQGQSGAITKTTAVTLNVVSLSVSFTADPSSGAAPLNGVDLTATVSGTAVGTINYKFDCTNDGIWEIQVNNSNINPYTAVDLCDYSTAGNYTAKVRVERDVANSVEGTTTITVTPPITEYPIWQSCETGTLYGPSVFDWSMGYKFVSTINGQVTKLCGFFQGTKWVRLYNSAYSSLSSAQVTGNAPIGWVCTSITSVNITAGSVYYAVAEMAGSGGYYRTSPGLPKACNNVTINASAYQLPSGTFDGNHWESTTAMYGMADIMFAY